MFLYFTLFVAFSIKSANKLNIDSVYYLPLIINFQIIKFILGFSVALFLLSLAVRDIDPTFLFRNVFQAPIVVFIIIFSIVNLLWPRKQQTQISPSELEKHKQIIIYYNLITFVVTYLILCTMFLIVAGNIKDLVAFMKPAS